jgi:hypothetical protein
MLGLIRRFGQEPQTKENAKKRMRFGLTFVNVGTPSEPRHCARPRLACGGAFAYPWAFFGLRPLERGFRDVAVSNATYRAVEAHLSTGAVAACATPDLRLLPGLLLLRRP